MLLTFKKYWYIAAVIAIFALHIFLRTYQMETRAGFGWDQVDNAWAVESILVKHEMPLVGMQAKGNSGFAIGPLYYYYLVPFYFATNLDPIASPIAAAFTSTLGALVLFFVTKKLFSKETALLAIFINAVSIFAIASDRSQWPVDFIPMLSLLVLYFLYKALTDKPKNFIFLAICMGLMFHIHFTAIFFPIASLLCIPFIRWTKQTIVYIVASIIIFLLFFIPNVFAIIFGHRSDAGNLTKYVNTYYHGFHLRRVMQLTHDAFIEFQQTLHIDGLNQYSFIFLPLFLLVYLWKNISRNTIILSYLFILWFVIPWVIFSTYKGELTDYYFISTRFLVIIVFACISTKLWQKNLFAKIFILGFWIWFGYFNLSTFLLSRPDGNIPSVRREVQKHMQTGEVVQWSQGDPNAYWYEIVAKVRR